MPEVSNYETEKEWMAACVPVRIDEGNEQDQAVAACLNIWRNKGKATNTLKAISTDEDWMRVANYLVLWGDEQRRDLEGWGSNAINPDGSKGEFFTAKTVLNSPYTRIGRIVVDYEHGQGKAKDGKGAPGPDDPLGYVDWSTAKADERGLWVERALDRHNAYMQWLELLISKGVIGTSSEAIPDEVEKAANGEITRWPIRRDTLTLEPMEWRNKRENIVRAAKALGVELPEDIAPEPEAPPEAVTTAAGAAKGTEQPTKTIQQEDTMSEEQTTNVAPEPQVDVAAIAKQAAEEAVKAYRAELAKEPTKGGLVVVADETDKALKAKPFTGFGEFLMAVKNMALGQVDKRLLPLRSQDTADEGGYDMTKALGPEFVGGLTKSAFSYLKQTGLHEGLGATGGFLVDTDHNMSIMQRVYDQGDLLRRCAMDGLSANSNGMTYNAINETSRADGHRMGGIRAYWTAEAGTKVYSLPAFRQIELKLKKVAALVAATDEQLKDANALESWIMRNLPDELRFVVEDSVINGTGVGMPQGILVSLGIVSVAKEVGQAADTVVVPNIVKMWSRMWARSRRNAAWFIHQDLEPQLFQLQLPVGTGGQAVYMPPGGLSASPYATLMGRPVVPIEYCQTVGTVGDIILGDFSQYQMIEKGGIQSASSIHVLFITDQSIFRFVYRVDGENTWNSPLTPKNGANTVAPFVTLASRD